MHITNDRTAPRILIVDDDPGIRSLFVRILEEVGYLVTPVADGRQALISIRQRQYELIILDLSLPEVDGLDIMRSARREYPWIKLLIVSGFMRGTVNGIASKLGADETLDKILAPKELLDESLSIAGPNCIVSRTASFAFFAQQRRRSL